MKTKKIHLLPVLCIFRHKYTLVYSLLLTGLITNTLRLLRELGHCQINVAAHYISGHVHLFIILYSLYTYVSVQVYSM